MKSLFEDTKIRTKEQDKVLLKKAKKKSPASNSGGGISTKMSQIISKVEQYLGRYRKDYLLIDTEEVLVDYIDKCIDIGIMSLDTETTGLDPLSDDIVGVCLYSYGLKPAYVPIGHKSYVTGMKSKKPQLSKDVVARELQRLAEALVKLVMFNALFDVRICKNTLGVLLTCWWDTSIASRCLNENEKEGQRNLKYLHSKYVLHGQQEEFDFGTLFKGVNFALVPIETAFLYAAHDAKDTLEYYDFQAQFLDLNHEREDMRNLAWMFFNIEMPIVPVVVDLEDTGVAYDLDYNEELKKKYSKKLEEAKKEAYKVIDVYKSDIAKYRGDTRLDNPINLDSPKQLSVLIYDIIGIKSVDKKNPRGTGEEILGKIDHPIAKAILDYRTVGKLMSTYIDKLPNCINKKDGRIHCHFNQYGADTGRFSSSEPNLQNIPSHNKDIRKVFKATDGYVWMSSDFSQQEICGMAQLCGDEGMLQSFREGKDFYAQIASVSFNEDYVDCLEFQVDENGEKILDKNGEPVTNPAGKERRGSAKSILLGINYGRGAASIAEQLGCTKQKAEKIKTSVFRAFPAIEEFEKSSKKMASELGYVTTLWGRKRRLPIMTHADYEFDWISGASMSDDPLDFDSEDVEEDIPDEIMERYSRQLANTWDPKKKASIIAQAKAEGIAITDNSKAKIDATRQIVNSRVQGTAADQAKLAMIQLYNDERLRELGFRMLIPVHDEILAECPKENAKEVKERFQYIMEHSGDDRLTIPIHCDVTVSDRWYGESIAI